MMFHCNMQAKFVLHCLVERLKKKSRSVDDRLIYVSCRQVEEADVEEKKTVIIILSMSAAKTRKPHSI
jgi:hypothetical protein